MSKHLSLDCRQSVMRVPHRDLRTEPNRTSESRPAVSGHFGPLSTHVSPVFNTTPRPGPVQSHAPQTSPYRCCPPPPQVPPERILTFTMTPVGGLGLEPCSGVGVTPSAPPQRLLSVCARGLSAPDLRTSCAAFLPTWRTPRTRARTRFTLR